MAGPETQADHREHARHVDPKALAEAKENQRLLTAEAEPGPEEPSLTLSQVLAHKVERVPYVAIICPVPGLIDHEVGPIAEPLRRSPAIRSSDCVKHGLGCQERDPGAKLHPLLGIEGADRFNQADQSLLDQIVLWYTVTEIASGEVAHQWSMLVNQSRFGDR